MLQFLSENWGNILVAVLVAAAVAGALLSLRKRKKSGCACGCGGYKKAGGEDNFTSGFLLSCGDYSASGVTLTYDLPSRFLQNDTVPSTSANSVWSLPMPTFSPAL